MANSPNLITRSTNLAAFLATPVSDGTYADVINTTKIDQAGREASATDIPEYAGQLVANLWDDATQRVIEMYDRGTKVWLVADATARDALGSDDNLAANDLAFQADTTGIFYCVSVDGGSASTWDAIAATGNVAGPGASTDNAIARWDGAGGATLQNSLVIVSDTGALSGITNITLSGTVDGRDVSADGATLDSHVANIANPHSTLLAQVLAAGNDTDGTHVLVTNGDEINGQDGGYVRFAAGTGIVELSDTKITGDLEVTGMIDPVALILQEQAVSPTNAAGTVTLWAKDTTPTTFWFTDDTGTDYQVSTATALGLNSVLLIGNVTGGNDILVTNGDAIRGRDGAASAGADVTVQGGAGDGAAQLGGTVALTGGTGSSTGDGGSAFVNGGTGGATSGAGGQAALTGGSAVAGNSAGGGVSMTAGAPSGSGAPGDVTISAANAAGTGNVDGGSVGIVAGDGNGSGLGGEISITAGDASATGSGTGGLAKLRAGSGGQTGDGGYALLQGGDGGSTSGTGGSALVTAGAGVGSGAAGGTVEITAGNAGTGAATGGSVLITSGDGGATSGSSGGINITTGATNSGARGSLTLDADTINLSADTNIVITNQSYHSVRGSTARGSTNTLIYRWTSVVDNVGSDITYTDSATNGGSWAINRAGVYSVSVSIDVGHNGYIAIKKAAAVSNTFDATDIMVASEAATGITQTMSWTGYCAAGDDIWVATNTATNPTGTPVNNNRVTITRVR